MHPVKQLRTSLGMTQKVFASAISLAPSTIGMIETLARKPSLTTLQAIKKIAKKHNKVFKVDDLLD